MIRQQRFVECASAFDVLYRPGFQQIFEGRQSRCAADRVAAESGDMSQYGIGLEAVHDLLTGCERSQRHPAAEGFGQADDVGCDAVLAHGEHFARASHPGLNFVEDEQRTHLVATSPQGFEPSGNRGPYARFALHGFDHDAGRAAGDESQLVEIVEVDRPHIGQQRPERALPLLAFGLTHQAHGSLRRTVIGPAHRDQLRAVGVSLGELQGPFDRFGARIDEIDARKFSRQQLGDACGVPHLRSRRRRRASRTPHRTCPPNGRAARRTGGSGRGRARCACSIFP